MTTAAVGRQATSRFVEMTHDKFVLVTYDSCRYDTLTSAYTPVLDSFGPVHLAQSPGNFTYPAHQAFFVGILPLVPEDLPYLNRFNSQLLGLLDVGETNVAKKSLRTVSSDWNLLTGLRDTGYQVVGTGAMNWFRQHSLTSGFERFEFTGTDAAAQVRFLHENLDLGRPFFAFVNFGETHAPYTFQGKQGSCPIRVQPRVMDWPPKETGPVGAASEAFGHQVQAAEFLDRHLGMLLETFPEDTVVIFCADHGDCFGEDGYWGHGFNHPMVLNVPFAVFRLDGRPF